MDTLAPELLLTAYTRGYFPMADAGGRIGWYLPGRRAVFLPGDAHVSRSTLRTMRSGTFSVAFDRDFAAVIRACSAREETWISMEIIEAYTRLHLLGFAHSVETYVKDQLVGGLYGVALGGAFFGESMFQTASNASKVAFASLVQRLDEREFSLHDAQFLTPHLERLGAREISCEDYLRRLDVAMRLRCLFR